MSYFTYALKILKNPNSFHLSTSSDDDRQPEMVPTEGINQPPIKINQNDSGDQQQSLSKNKLFEGAIHQLQLKNDIDVQAENDSDSDFFK